MSGVDWSAPIEAVHEDGRVSRGVMFEGYAKSHPEAAMCWMPTEFRTYFGRDGEPIYPECGWRIRNVLQPAADAKGIDSTDTLPTAPSGGEVGPEVVERMIALVRRLSASLDKGSTVFPSLSSMEHYAEARAIVALLPEPVDADLVEARRIAVEQLTAPGQSEVFLGLIADGTNDHYSEVRIALAAIKRGRALAAGDR